jgi:hypothetical protein
VYWIPPGPRTKPAKSLELTHGSSRVEVPVFFCRNAVQVRVGLNVTTNYPTVIVDETKVFSLGGIAHEKSKLRDPLDGRSARLPDSSGNGGYGFSANSGQLHWWL